LVGTEAVLLISSIAFLSRALLIALFLPFSALDKVLNFKQAVEQAQQSVRNLSLAVLLIAGGFTLEVTMSLAVVTGVADRLAALVLAFYCCATALLWKQFWKQADFRLRGSSAGRDVFWDFLKNLSLAGGFLVLALGADGAGFLQLLAHPLDSTHPYMHEAGAH
jgi:putative oxidoreductase